MATKALITPEQYLSMHFEREPELVHGELVERPLPTFPHGNLQLQLGSRLRALQPSYTVFTGVEVCVQIAPDVFRVPDISMWTGPEPPPKLPIAPPILVVEVSSPDERIHDVLQKFEEYRAWGVQHVARESLGIGDAYAKENRAFRRSRPDVGRRRCREPSRRFCAELEPSHARFRGRSLLAKNSKQQGLWLDICGDRR
ncbi:MAG TPA: Uma2 family endonuclease [Bryobacteraceae bacterium]|nr:Uma2 family endonuclease [Bryobacteraceae bacterium]